jgi:hypothetical protein
MLVENSFNLGSCVEIADCELFAIYKALQSIKQDQNQKKEIFIFIDSQAAIRKLQNLYLRGGLELVYKISTLCDEIAAKVHFNWVPSHTKLFGNDLADRLAKQGLEKEKDIESFTSLSFIKRKIKETTIKLWETRYRSNPNSPYSKKKGIVALSLKTPRISGPRKFQSAYFQLLFEAGFFKSYSKKIGKDLEGRCFGNCTKIQTPYHLILECKHYNLERKQMEKEAKTTLSLPFLFSSKQGKSILQKYIQKTEIATQNWLLGGVEERN